MQEVIKFLNENSDGFLATLEDGKPRVRPYQFMLEDGGKLCFSTNNTKEVCKQLKANPAMEFSCANAQKGWLRLRGEVKFTNDPKVKEKIFAKKEWIKSIYKTLDNPTFEVFYLDHGMALMLDPPGTEQKTIEF